MFSPENWRSSSETRIFVLKAGDTLMAPRDIPHQLRNPGNVENHYLSSSRLPGSKSF